MLEQFAAIKILDGLLCLSRQKYQVGLLKLLEVTIPNTDESTGSSVIADLCTVNDLAFYICLSALVSQSRKELKNTVLKHTNFVTLTSDTPDA